MIKHDITDKIVTVSIDYRQPRGGIAQVLHHYSSFYETFNFVTTVTGEKVSRLSKALTGIKGYCQLLRYLIKRDIKIVHIHSAQGPSFYRKAIFALTSKAFGKKVILHIHAGKFKKFASEHPRLTKNVINSCDCVVALSENWKNYFTENYLGKAVYVINNPIEDPVFLDKEDTSVNRSTSTEGRQPVRICFLGKICDEKGIFDLLEVLKNRKDKFEGRLKLTIGGVGETERLNKYIADNHLEGIAQYIGWVSGQSKIELFNNSDALILPSYFEGIPLCILEAMSYGLTVAATEVGGIPEMIEHGKTGYLFHPRDLDGIERTLELIIDNTGDKPMFHDQAKASVAKHSLEEVEKSLTQLYTTLLNE